MRSSDATANGLADIVGLRRCPLNATLRMVENLIRVLMWFITDARSSFVFFESVDIFGLMFYRGHFRLTQVLSRIFQSILSSYPSPSFVWLKICPFYTLSRLSIIV